MFIFDSSESKLTRSLSSFEMTGGGTKITEFVFEVTRVVFKVIEPYCLLLLKATTPGKSLPSNHSINAPPAVEM